MVITMYYGKTKKYEFIILDMNTLRCATADSIKNAKLAVMELANSLDTPTEMEVEEEIANTPEETPEVAEEVQEEVHEESVEEGQEEATTEKPASKKNKK